MIKITERAKTKMVDVLIDERSRFLRFGLRGGGCSGMNYYFSVERERDTDDLEISLEDGYILLVDSFSIMYLEGTEVDYKQDLMGENFVFNNPKVLHSCGCGSSVSF